MNELSTILMFHLAIIQKSKTPKPKISSDKISATNQPINVETEMRIIRDVAIAQ